MRSRQYEAEVPFRRGPRVETGAPADVRANRELVNLVVVGILTGLGFASVYIARQSVISAGSVSYALIFLGLYLAAHAVARITVPWADPYLLPLTGLLTAIGLTEIYRLGPSDAFRQGFWIVVGVGVFAVTLVLAARPTSGCSRATSTSSGSRASACSCCRRCR